MLVGITVPESFVMFVFLFAMIRHCFFFFQAEDGIRDHCVTGVQTCALPISPLSLRDIRYEDGPLPRSAHRHREPESALPGYLDAARHLLGSRPAPNGAAMEHLQTGPDFEHLKIGRASCRERVQIWGVERALE